MCYKKKGVKMSHLSKYYRFTALNGSIQIIMAKNRYNAWNKAIQYFGRAKILKAEVINN